MTQLSDSRKKILFIAFITILLAWVASILLDRLFYAQVGRIFANYYDRVVYFERGKWLIENKPAISEYPQIPTFLFGVTHLLTLPFPAELRSSVYVAVFGLEMAIALGLVFWALLGLLPAGRGKYALLLLLPPTIYFTFSHFDILPALLCLLAYQAAAQKRWNAAAIWLALGAFTKWYPALLFPGFLLYAGGQEKKFQWKMVIWFGIVAGTNFLLAYLQGGAQALLTPYLFHLSRGMEFTSLPVLLNDWVSQLGMTVNDRLFFMLFFLAQISGVGIVFFTKINSLQRLLNFSILTTGLFILFSRIWSPQWFLWLIPFLILAARNKTDLVLIALYNLTTYLNFPLTFDWFGEASPQLKFTSLLTYLLLGVILWRKTFQKDDCSSSEETELFTTAARAAENP